MLRSIFSAAAKLRFALWALEAALPNGADLKRRFRSALIGVVAAVAAGVLSALGTAAAICAVGFALYYFAIMPALYSIAVSVMLAIAVIWGLICYAKKQLDMAYNSFDPEATANSSGSAISGSSGDVFGDIINGFVEGIIVGGSAEKPAPQTPDISPATEAAHLHATSYKATEEMLKQRA